MYLMIPMNRYLYLFDKVLTAAEDAVLSGGQRALAMLQIKPRSFRVVLDGEVGGHAMMLVMGCADMDECIRYALKTKDKTMKIREVQEIKRGR